MDTVYVVSWCGDPDILIFKSLENAKKELRESFLDYNDFNDPQTFITLAQLDENNYIDGFGWIDKYFINE